MVGEIGGAAVDEVGAPDVMHCRVDFPGEHHAAQALFRRHLPDQYARWRLEADRAAMAVRRHALHPPFHVARLDAELVLERPARPERGRLLVFRHADALAFQIRRLLNPGGAPPQELGPEKPARGEDREFEPPRVPPSPDPRAARPADDPKSTRP